MRKTERENEREKMRSKMREKMREGERYREMERDYCDSDGGMELGRGMGVLKRLCGAVAVTGPLSP